MLPVLREAVRPLSADEITQLLSCIPWPTLTVLDPTQRLADALRSAALSPEPGDQPHTDLVTAVVPEQARPLAVLIWRQQEHAEHPRFWYALGAEVAAASGVTDYPAPWPPIASRGPAPPGFSS